MLLDEIFGVDVYFARKISREYHEHMMNWRPTSDKPIQGAWIEVLCNRLGDIHTITYGAAKFKDTDLGWRPAMPIPDHAKPKTPYKKLNATPKVIINIIKTSRNNPITYQCLIRGNYETIKNVSAVRLTWGGKLKRLYETKRLEDDSETFLLTSHDSPDAAELIDKKMNIIDADVTVKSRQ